MPQYPYYIDTRVGRDAPYDSESNISPHLMPGSLVSLHTPQPSTIDSGRAIIFNPVLHSDVNGVRSYDGKVIGLEELAPYI